MKKQKGNVRKGCSLGWRVVGRHLVCTKLYICIVLQHNKNMDAPLKNPPGTLYYKNILFPPPGKENCKRGQLFEILT
jgi:hypothetical protein